MKRFAVYYLVFCSVTYFVIYLGFSFVNWSLENPFQWVLDIPVLTPGGRLGLLGTIFLFLLVSMVFSASLYAVFFPSDEDNDDVRPYAIRNNSYEEKISDPHYYRRRENVSNKSDSLSATDIALGVGAGIVGAEIIDDIFGGDDCGE